MFLKDVSLPTTKESFKLLRYTADHGYTPKRGSAVGRAFSSGIKRYTQIIYMFFFYKYGCTEDAVALYIPIRYEIKVMFYQYVEIRVLSNASRGKSVPLDLEQRNGGIYSRIVILPWQLMHLPVF